MKNSFGDHLILTLFGESHGPCIGAVLDGLAPGIRIDREWIDRKLSLRRPQGKTGTGRREPDPYQLVSGTLVQADGEEYTTGSPLCLLIPNQDRRSGDYEAIRYIPRPGHADYAAFLKYHGFQDYRGGGHFSGRLTAALVAAGAICGKVLADKGVYIGTQLEEVDGIQDLPLTSLEGEDLLQAVKELGDQAFPVLDREKGEAMQEAIVQAARERDSLGGILGTAVLGLDGGLGEPWFDSVESLLSHALFSIPAVKGVSFGDGFALARMRGSEANDSPCLEGGKVVFRSNHNGGINGGITNGMPLFFHCVVKPTPSIGREQDSIDLSTGQEKSLVIQGRHDPAIVHRASQVVNAMTAICLYDLMAGRYGIDAMR